MTHESPNQPEAQESLTAGVEPLLTTNPVEELLESRMVARDFQVEGGTVSVETRIRLSRNPWTVASVVLENGVEVQEGPFAPLRDEVDTSTFDPEALADLRREVATRVLAIHESRCREVERALGRGGAPRRSGGKALGIAFVSVLVLAALGGGGYYWWFHRAAQDSAPSSSADNAVGANPEAPAQTEPTQDESHLTPGRPPAQPSAKNPTARTVTPPAPGPTSGTAARPNPHHGREASVHTLAQRPQEREQERSKSASQATSPEPEPADPPGRPDPGGEGEPPSLVTDILPATYRLGSLRVDALAFSDDGGIFAAAPESELGLPCIRTSFKDRTEEIEPTFRLQSPAVVLVGHDPRIHKKPKWLQPFTPTGQRWEVNDVGIDHEVVSLEVFSKRFPAGPVHLGPNVQWSALTRKLREIHEKDLAMYVVCLDPK